MTAGALVLLFLGWQLVWTDVTAGAAAAATTSQVSARFAATDPARGGLGSPGDSGSPGESRPGPTGAGAAAAAGQRDAVPVEVEPPVGTAFALVHVPRFGAGWSVAAVEGTGREQVLDQGVLGHYRGTAMPGGAGNLALAGHRTTYGAPLSRIDELVSGDPVVVETARGWFVYRVTGHEVVAPDAVEVIAPVPGAPGAEPTTGVLTLTSCHPRYSARQRWVVHASLESQTPRSAGVPAALTTGGTGGTGGPPGTAGG